MSEIHVLNAEVYNKISAGEVIEKPASVVKELVENALDAGATAIRIDYEGGGLDSIVVTDNGKGIAREDLPLVFMPHATSKIAEANDLEHIVTLGFRGEAMASIAAAAQVRISSYRDGQAFTVQVNGGEMGEITPSGIAIGTEVMVRNLFYHTPARLKFLKSAKQEGRDILALCERFIIANPTVRFDVYSGGKALLQTLGQGMDEAVRVVFGEENFDNMLHVDAQEYGYHVEGYISNTDLTAGTRASQITVLNGRVVNNANLSASINNAYRDYLMKRNYALFALHITIPTDEVDVNVHPTKADVRFTYGNKLFGMVYRVVRKALEGYLSGRNIVFDAIMQAADQRGDKPQNASETSDFSDFFAQDSTAHSAEQTRLSFAETGEAMRTYGGQNFWQRVGADRVAPKEQPERTAQFDFHDDRCAAEEILDLLTMQTPSEQANSARQIERAEGLSSGITTNEESKEQSQNESIHSFDSTALRIVGQILGTYIVAEYDGEMLLIDQHAAAERVLYNDLMRQYAGDNMPVQPMLIPYTFTLGEEESQIIAGRMNDIKALGIDITQDSDNTFSLHAMPALLVDMDVMQFVHILLSDGFDCSTGSILHEKLAYAACRAAIKGNHYMDNDALALLCKNLFEEALPGQCPHGRPAYVKISRYQLEKMFKRIV